MSPKGQEETSYALLIERPGNSEADDANSVRGCASSTIGGAYLVNETGPGTSTQPMVAAIASHPRRSVDRCMTVVLVYAVLYPLPDIANHFIETELVRRE